MLLDDCAIQISIKCLHSYQFKQLPNRGISVQNGVLSMCRPTSFDPTKTELDPNSALRFSIGMRTPKTISSASSRPHSKSFKLQPHSRSSTKRRKRKRDLLTRIPAILSYNRRDLRKDFPFWISSKVCMNIVTRSLRV